MNLTGLNFDLQIEGIASNTFSVAAFELDEAISELFTLSLTVVSTDPSIEMKALLLKSACFVVQTNGQSQRTLAGIIGSIMQGKIGFKRTFYTITIVPPLWKLTQKKDSRIFHFKSVPEIIDQILAEHNVSVDSKLFDSHLPREYITQKRETDYDFLSRLAAEEGISFWFETNESGSAILFYSDSRLGCTASLSLIYNPHPQATDIGHLITELSFGAKLAPTQAIFKDRTYQNPSYSLQHSGDVGSAAATSTIFDSYGRFQDDGGKQLTQYRLDALRKETEVGYAQSNCFAVRPGDMFELSEHPNSHLNQRWQTVSVRHQGKLPQVLQEESDGSAATVTNEFKFIPAMTEWRPDFIHKPLADGAEVAEVCGPAGEEIYTNEDGSIKVHFHWNRYDQADENASCWVRVAQGWNGENFGFSAIPRIGQEVIITYLDGDIDRPLVTGCVYNAKNRPPLKLPVEKTRTTFKTKTHKGEGFNELRFDDANGQEEIFIHAQKDMDLQVRNSKNERVDFDRQTSIGHDEFLVVANNRVITVEGRQDHKTTGSIFEKIEGDNNITIAGDLMQKISGVLGIKANGDLTLESHSRITLKVGNSFIIVHSSGIDINGPIVNIGPQLNVCSSGSPGNLREPLDPKLLAALAGSGMSFIERCPAAFREELNPLSDYQKVFTLKNSEGEPIAGQKYRLTSASGKVFEGVSDADGCTECIYTDKPEDIKFEYLT